MVRRTASFRFACPRITFPQVGEQASSKSAMNACTGAFSALMIILRSTGPVISSRRSSRSFGTGEMRQLPARTASVARRKSGNAPSSNSAWSSSPRVEAAVQAREQLQRERRQHFLRALELRSQDLELRSARLARVEARLALGVHTPEAYAVWPRI